MMRKYILPLVMIFVVTNGLFIAGKHFFTRKGFDTDALIIGNLVLFLASLVSFFIVKGGVTGKNNSAFIRSIYGGFLGKLMVILGGIVIYMTVATVNKPAIILLMVLYLFYTVAEVGGLMKLNKAQRNA